MIRTEIVPTHELNQRDARLDGGYFCSVGEDTRRLLMRASVTVKKIRDVSTRIFIGGRTKRYYVSDKSYGIPFLSSSDMLLADLTNVPYVSRQMQSGLTEALLEEGWTLISRSGTIGNVAYANADFAGKAASEHVMRVAPNERIRSGYLFAWLSSVGGVGLLKQGTFGSVIPTIEPAYVADLPIPRLDDAIEQAIHEHIEQAAVKRVEANRLLCEADRSLHDTVDLPDRFSVMHDHSFAVGSVQSSDLARAPYRLDAYFHTGYAGEAKDWRSDKWPMVTLGGALSRVFNPPIFKRIRAEEGVPYLLGAEVYQAHPRPSTRIAWSTPNLREYLLQRDMIAFEDAGQRYGLLGTPVFIGRTVAGNAATNNMTRLVPRSSDDAGYVFALLNSEFGRRMIVRQSYGTSLPHILPDWIAALRVPWPGDDERRAVAKLVLEAVELRDEANELEDEAQEMLRHALDAAVGSELGKSITVGE